MSLFKTFMMNYDGTNTAAVQTQFKKDALKALGVSAYLFNEYGHGDHVEWTLPTYGEVWYRPITTMLDTYPWRKERYRLRHDDHGRAYYE